MGTILSIVVLVLLFGGCGGGYYGYRRSGLLLRLAMASR